jgi:hypothetical protein
MEIVNCHHHTHPHTKLRLCHQAICPWTLVVWCWMDSPICKEWGQPTMQFHRKVHVPSNCMSLHAWYDIQFESIILFLTVWVHVLTVETCPCDHRYSKTTSIQWPAIIIIFQLLSLNTEASLSKMNLLSPVKVKAEYSMMDSVRSLISIMHCDSAPLVIILYRLEPEI